MSLFFELCEKKIRMVSSDSEPEELETAVVHSQISTITDTLSAPGVEELIVETKRVSVAWLCFDREKAYQRHGIDYVKCK